jgi:Ca-activated chloride channel family protein
MKWLAMVVVIGLPVILFSVFGLDAAARSFIGVGLYDAASVLSRDPLLRGEALYRAQRFVEAAEAFRQLGPPGSYNLGNALAQSGHLQEAITAFDAAIGNDSDDEDAVFNRSLVANLLERTQSTDPKGPIGTGGNSALAATRNNQPVPDAGAAELTATGEGRAGAHEGNSQDGARGASKVSKTGYGEKKIYDVDEFKGQGSAGDSEGIGLKGDLGAQWAKMTHDWVRRYGGKVWAQQSLVPTQMWLKTVADDPGKYLKLRLILERSRRLEAAAVSAGSVR